MRSNPVAYPHTLSLPILIVGIGYLAGWGIGPGIRSELSRLF